MDYTLALEGATYGGSVALLRDAMVIAERTLVDNGIPSRGGREERVLPSIAECLGEARIGVEGISRVICGAGPGSFTSLRIAASVAKGIAVGVGCPMFSVSSLLLSVVSARDPLADGLYLSVLPAMRNEWFAALFEVAGSGPVVQLLPPSIVADSELAPVAAEAGASLLGPDRDIDSRPHARGVAKLLDQIISAGPVALDTWEPDYGRLAEAQVKWEAAQRGGATGVAR
jgi:tRNA threonylcarbamoyladenosine biosynthesis protein TsaB